MGVYVTTSDRGRVWAAVLAGLAALALLVALVVLLPLAALTMVLGLAVSGVALLLQRAGALRAPARGRAAPAGTAEALGPTLQIVDAEGDVLSARAVPLAGAGEHTLALTRDGYVLLDAEGRVIHQL